MAQFSSAFAKWDQPREVQGFPEGNTAERVLMHQARGGHLADGNVFSLLPARFLPGGGSWRQRDPQGDL